MSYDVEIVAIGDELLNGTITDTNGQWLCDQLRGMGARVRWKQTVADHINDIVEALNRASERASLVVVGGGLGGTSDDMTTEAAAQLTAQPLKLHTTLLTEIEQKRASHGRTLHESDKTLAQLPQTAQPLNNAVGLAPGFQIEHNDCILYFLPGVPREWKRMITDHVLPHVRQHLEHVSHERTWKFFGFTESALATIAQPIADNGVELHFRAHFPEIHLRATSSEPEALIHFGERLMAQSRHRCFGGAQDRFPAVINQALQDRGWTLSIAESCTGGLISQMVTSEPGASAIFQYGAITYANEAKQNAIAVDPTLLQTHGAVSEPVVRAMAIGIRNRAKSTLGIATSGIAGPDGGTEEKPVGTVHLALATPDTVIHRHHQFRGNREIVRKLAAYTALNLVRKACAGHYSEQGN